MKRKLLYPVLALCIAISSCSSEEKEDTQLVTLGDSNYRPEFHFTPERNWMNDPNGMVFYEGEYHLFFQHNPDANVWGPMHWGHAVSKDLINWEELPIALYPDELGNIFSGSAVVDKNNTAGFKTGEEDPLVAVFTHQNPADNSQKQSLAYSNDKGRTWVKYEGNPVLENELHVDFRDPKVIWHEAVGKWIMVVAAGQKILFYSSSNLKEWDFLQSFGEGMGAHGGVWECPDLFLVTNENGEQKWALLVSINPGGPNGGSATQYFLGSFDGHEFRTDQEETLWLDYGTDNYAGVTWANEPDNRNLFIGWMSNWMYAQDVPTNAWRSAMTLPRTLSLSEDGNNILSYPAREINVLEKTKTASAANVSEFILVDDETLESRKFLLKADFDLSEATEFTINWGNGHSAVNLSYNKSQGIFLVDRSNAGFNFRNVNNNLIRTPFELPEDGKISLEMWVDKSSVEVFLNRGQRATTFLIFPNTDYGDISVTSNTGTEFIESIDITALGK